MKAGRPAQALAETDAAVSGRSERPGANAPVGDHRAVPDDSTGSAVRSAAIHRRWYPRGNAAPARWEGARQTRQGPRMRRLPQPARTSCRALMDRACWCGKPRSYLKALPMSAPVQHGCVQWRLVRGARNAPPRSGDDLRGHIAGPVRRSRCHCRGSTGWFAAAGPIARPAPECARRQVFGTPGARRARATRLNERRLTTGAIPVGRG
jgi:hypothetical protein